MAEPIGKKVRFLVAKRANFLCEYCLIAEVDTFIGCEVDHIISIKHGGITDPDNLAYACAYCNRYKGSDIASLTNSGKLVSLYNPRADIWKEHFWISGFQILPVSQIGEVTVSLLRMNHRERTLERETLQSIGRFPSEVAKKIILD